MTSQRPNERIDAATIDANQCYDAVVGGDACAELGQQTGEDLPYIWRIGRKKLC